MLTVLTLLTCLQPPAPPSDPMPRARMFGIVRQADGKPWAGATVHFVATTEESVPAVGPLERLEAKTGSRGRFRVDVIDGWSYRVWAEQTDDDGGFRASNVATAMAGRPLVLKEQKQTGAITVLLQGLGPWRKQGELKAFVSWELTGELEELAIESDSVTLPARTVAARPRILLRNANGALVYAFYPGTRHGRRSVEIPAPRRCLIRLRHKKDGEVPAARVVFQHADRAELVGHIPAGGEGEISLAIKSGGNPWQYRILVPGYRPAVLRGESEAKEGDEVGRKVLEAGGQLWQGCLLEGEPLKLKFTDAEGRPIAGAKVLLACSAESEVEDSHSYVANANLLVETGTDGVLEASVSRHDFRLSLVVTPEIAARLPESWRNAWPVVGLMWASLYDKSAQELRLDQALWLADVTLAGSSGTPIENGELQIGGINGNSFFSWLKVPANRRGQARVLLPRGRLAFLGRHAQSMGVVAYDASLDKAVRARRASWEFRMDPEASLEVLVRDKEGKPSEGISVYAHPEWNQPAVSKRELGEPVNGTGAILQPVEVQSDEFRSILSSIARFSGRTDAEGRCRFYLPWCEATLQVTARTDAGSLQDTVRFVAGEENVVDFGR